MSRNNLSSEYVPLRADSELASDDGFGSSSSPRPRSPVYASKESSLSVYLTVIFSILSIVSALALHANVVSGAALDYSNPRHLGTLRKLRPYPNMEHMDKVRAMNAMPIVVSPSAMVRANAADPEHVYTNSSSFTLSPTDSMFYRWATVNRAMTMCYISAVVPNITTLEAGDKTLYSEGDVGSIEVWNVTDPSGPLDNIKWNSRPTRISRLGSVNFAHTNFGIEDGVDGWELKPPTPAFDCSGYFNITVELACNNCTVRFSQVESGPPLGFELQELR
ncbi:hypothetical protein FIBSPDRAFT_773570 [Athelia psychrophila]|uniref:Ubiquitin 3 binding protein But2 C-terminal domain-containing protein n=1 Tax=Athelia psychrophila TaxID=1759441 RepID=A0A166VUI7_9AGAM|nr:hypothetical protein FIBSPDRAFT_773570 [Fibularhizoctonia sp. CBS 109695]